VIVTSGAIGAGISQLNMQEKPSDLVLKQACAAIGQSSIISYYERYFKEYGKLVAQVLLTQDDLLDKTKRTNIINPPYGET
jgi:glutamate 5-kinase